MSFYFTVDPSTGLELNRYQLLSANAIFKQIEASQKTFLSWRQIKLEQRLQFFEHFIKVLEKLKIDCARWMAFEMGKPITDGLAEIDKCILVCRYYIEHAPIFLAPVHLPTEYHQSMVVHQPLGLILAVMPWNFPFWQVLRACIPALISGNGILLKHARQVSACALKIEEMFLEAGFPENVFKTLLIDHREVASVIAHPNVRGVTVTGSEAVGRDIAACAGQHIKKVVLELGGNDAAIVMADADIEYAAQCITNSRLRNAGQVCVSSKRVVVAKPIYDDLIQALKKEMAEIVVGSPLEMATMMGPMARNDLRATLDHQVQTAIKQGADCLVGGKMPDGPGFYYPATLLSQVKLDSVVYQQELFGPVIAVSSYEDVDEAIHLANATSYGLGSSIYSADLERAADIASHMLEAGISFVNMPVRSDPRFPFGGIKNSGFGRELAKEGMLEFTNVKTVIVHAP